MNQDAIILALPALAGGAFSFYFLSVYFGKTASNACWIPQIYFRLSKLILLLMTTSKLLAVESSIQGIVRDEATHQPLIGTNIIVEGTEMGAAADANGKFIIPDVPPGFYHVRFEMIGYQPLVKLNVRVLPERGVFITAELVQSAIELKQVTVTRAYYQKEKDAFVSSRTVDFEEIRRDPSGVIDIQRMMQALPSVVSASDQQNEIVVRGGAPGENLFLMDNIEITNPNHFGEQGTGGGPINMLNTLFIDRVDFLAGAFPAKYGDKASSVMDIRLREGSRDYHAVDLDMSMAGIGMFVEGPLAKGQGSYMTSYRKSYLDLIIRSTGLVAVPSYWNAQAKLTYDLNPANKLMLNVIYGDDAIHIKGENTPSTRGAENVNVSGKQSVLGLTYKKLWGNQALSRFTLAWTSARFNYDVYRFSEKGIKHTYYQQNETEWDVQARGDFVWRIYPSLEISGGIDLKQLGADFDAWSDNDTVWIYAYALPSNPDSFIILDQITWKNEAFPIINGADPDSIYLDNFNIWNYGHKDQDGKWEFVRVKRVIPDMVYEGWSNRIDDSFLRSSVFFQVKWRPSSVFTVNVGSRFGYFEYTDFFWISPRLALSYHLSDRTTVNFALGRHFQTPSLIVLTNFKENKKLRSKNTNQIVLGLEHFFSEVTRGTVEIYQKTYDDIPVPLSVTTVDTTDRSLMWVNKGEGYSYGIEFFLQKKLAKDFFGTFSYSRSVAMAMDPRYPEKKKYYPRDFDFRNVLTTIGGYKFPLRGPGVKPLQERSWLARFLARTIGRGAQEVELSFRYRYIGGKPYTSQIYNPMVRRWYVEEGVEYNTRRLSQYHRFDIMVLWHYNFGRVSLVSYLNIQNVFNRDNIWDIQRNSDGTKSKVYQFKVFPVGGFTLEF